ncbi:Pentatricopeptide repeat-containing protein [Quillaja saponaria]|uniref:Pentatricopeptide repeat-containing protein n=1 Tax=Quillaja saponaria TaxID=32244 RepID=A0AAD7L830_QUISA|nr:Pentatricopeptide repeat-containing protein [Quillaja saponaria]
MRIWLRSQRAISSLSTTIGKAASFFELNHLLQACCNTKSLNQGKQVHQQMILNGLHNHVFMYTKLIQMYADCDDLASAQTLFDKLLQPNVFAWTAIIGFYSRHGLTEECMITYRDLKSKGVTPDGYVFPKVLRACAQLSCLDWGTLVHKDVVIFGSGQNIQVCNSMIDMYSKCGDIRSARRVFEEMVERDLLSWNTIISGSVYNGLLELAVELLDYMRLEGYEPDIVTWNTVMDAYCRMGLCEEGLEMSLFPAGIWGLWQVEKKSMVMVSKSNVGVGTEFYKSAGAALLTMYAKCSRIRDAESVFNMMDKSDVVTWNALIFGFADMGLGLLALKYFTEMQRRGIRNNNITISTVLPVCDLRSGKQIHAYIMKSSFNFAGPVSNALIHMYSKNGDIGPAYLVFSNMVSRDLVSWNTMISGYGMHGLGQAALKLLQEMNHSGLCPSSVTFTSALSACSHSGLIDEGLDLFQNMTRDFSFTPRMEHYSCVVDMLARAGRLEDAYNFINRMPIDPDKHIWGALLAACQEHQNVSIGKLAAEELICLEPNHAGHYVTLSNMYARAGKWDDAVRVRKLMEGQGSVKPSGHSLIGG